MPSLILNGNKIGGTVDDSALLRYNNEDSTLQASTIQDAVTELDEKVEANKVYTDEKIIEVNGKVDTDFTDAKAYTDEKIIEVKNDLLNGAGAAYDTLKELGDLISENADALDALEVVANSKQDAATAINTSNIGNQSVNYATVALCTGAINSAVQNRMAIRNYAGTPGSNHKQIFMQSDFSSNCVNVGIDGAGPVGVNKAKNADYATSAGSANAVAWGNVSGKPSSYTPASHTHPYLPLSGGTLEGNIYTMIVRPTSNQSYSLGLPNWGYTHVYANQLKSAGHADLEAASDSHNVYLRGAACSVKNVDNSVYVPIKASAFTNSSSIRYKENVESMTDEDAMKILKLRPVTYDYINKAEGINCMGLIAEEVAEVQDYSVIKNIEGEIDGLDYSKFVPQLIKMVQIQQNQIDKLQKEVNELKETITILKEES